MFVVNNNGLSFSILYSFSPRLFLKLCIPLLLSKGHPWECLYSYLSALTETACTTYELFIIPS